MGIAIEIAEQGIIGCIAGRHKGGGVFRKKLQALMVGDAWIHRRAVHGGDMATAMQQLRRHAAGTGSEFQPARMFRQWGGDIVGSGLLPEAYLARELELCYASLTAVGPADLLPILRAAAAAPAGQQGCTCGETMAFMKSQGIVGEDWRTW